MTPRPLPYSRIETCKDRITSVGIERVRVLRQKLTTLESAARHFWETAGIFKIQLKKGTLRPRSMALLARERGKGKRIEKP